MFNRITTIAGILAAMADLGFCSAELGILARISVGQVASRAPEPGTGTLPGGTFTIRRVSSGAPITDVSDPGMLCGPGAQKVQNQFTLPASSSLGFVWTQAAEPRMNWQNGVGPVITYITSCKGACSSFDPTDETKWFKYDQQGQADDGVWAQANFEKQRPVSTPIPNVPVGEYLVRQDVIDLTNANVTGGALFYVGCAQITVNSTTEDAALPAASQSVTFPGAYNQTDPGIFQPNLNGSYVFPGGPVATFGKGAQVVASASLANATISATAATFSTSTASSSASSSTITCNLNPPIGNDSAPLCESLNTSNSTSVTATNTATINAVTTSTTSSFSLGDHIRTTPTIPTPTGSFLGTTNASSSVAVTTALPSTSLTPSNATGGDPQVMVLTVVITTAITSTIAPTSAPTTTTSGTVSSTLSQAVTTPTITRTITSTKTAASVVTVVTSSTPASSSASTIIPGDVPPGAERRRRNHRRRGLRNETGQQ